MFDLIISIKQIPNGKWKENCYIISNINRDALIIDPGSSENIIITYIKENHLNASAILNTHSHYDHIGAISKLKKEYSIPLFLHSKDEKLLKTANLYSNIFDGIGHLKIPTIDYYFDKINIKDYITYYKIRILHTPGHTEGSVCLLIEDNLFTGDTLLNNRIGRVDLPGGDKNALIKSLNILSKFPHNINIYPGHGKPSTIGEQLKYNKEFIQVLQ